MWGGVTVSRAELGRVVRVIPDVQREVHVDCQALLDFYRQIRNDCRESSDIFCSLDQAYMYIYILPIHAVMVSSPRNINAPTGPQLEVHYPPFLGAGNNSQCYVYYSHPPSLGQSLASHDNSRITQKIAPGAYRGGGSYIPVGGSPTYNCTLYYCFEGVI